MTPDSAIPTPPKSSTLHLDTTPLSIRTIMMATDFSDESVVAANYAAGLAKQMGSRLEFLHVVPDELYLSTPYPLVSDLQELERARGRSALHEFLEKVPQTQAMDYEEIVVSGSPAVSIQRTAQEHAVDLLVMGSQGRRGVKKLALGSVAEKVIRQLHCPVLVTGPECVRDFMHLESVLLAVDVLHKSLRAAQYAAAIARQSGASLVVAHILPQESDGIGRETTESVTGDLQSLIPDDIELTRRTQFRTAHGDASGEILRIAAEYKTGIIVTSPQRHSLLADRALGNVLSKLIAGSRCPILSVSSHS